MAIEYGPAIHVHFNGKYLGTMGLEYPTNNQVAVFNNQVAVVKELTKSGVTLQDEAAPLKMHLNHMILGLSGEVGELDTENVKEEIGDLIFYILGLCGELGINIFECMAMNQEKLKNKRYSKGYSDQAAIERADKVNLEIPLQLETGCYYKSVKGKVYGPMLKVDDDDFPWAESHDQKSKFWSDTGRRFNDSKLERLTGKVDKP